jgi:hypothetical protein
VLTELQVSQIYLACGATDMRKSIDGLAVPASGYTIAAWSGGGSAGRRMTEPARAR